MQLLFSSSVWASQLQIRWSSSYSYPYYTCILNASIFRKRPIPIYIPTQELATAIFIIANEHKIVCFYNMYFIIAFAWIITTSAYALLHSGSFRSKTKKNALFNLNLYSFAISQFMYTFWCHCSANYLENEVFQYCLAGMKLSHFRLQYFHKYVLMQLSLRIISWNRYVKMLPCERCFTWQVDSI